MAPTLSHCAREVRREDRDRYLSALFAPDGVREALFALYAFNAEIARAREVVTEPLLGEIRLQWWRDALDGLYGGRNLAHPVVEALGRAIGKHGLKRAGFERMIDARAADLSPEPPADMATLEAYAGASSGTLMELALECLGVATPDARRAAQEAGIAYALVGLLRAVPFHARRKRLMLPFDRLRVAGLDTHSIFELRPSTALAQVVREVGELAFRHLTEARRTVRGLPIEAWPALLPAALVASDLARLRRKDWNPFALKAGPAGTGRQLRLTWARIVRRL
ncbi:MAG: phytoene/squalene synthase family protein [Alphaproteobacteria bacterium]